MNCLGQYKLMRGGDVRFSRNRRGLMIKADDKMYTIDLGDLRKVLCGESSFEFIYLLNSE